ncbi:RICIN domain-containing protein [Pedobacter sp. MC2016-24]|uniref:RICIN domain-containing protein n=1 Tax=Pedobacter sp. MC2016-24 TaxID=2780090 RepID=UPI00187DE6C7|nr:RICIN domain-containing protein [Pedobacter sp. MC2016-24]MBE9599814.1 RICIN domain-containing protein [Pedobacter sp. MC2016-24]
MIAFLLIRKKLTDVSVAIFFKGDSKQFVFLFFLLFLASQTVKSQFVHPGGVHNQADLNRMKTKVAANISPWIEGWNLMIADSKARNTYVANPSSNIGGSGIRQQAARDATAAYYNTLRWHITGDTTYANCAVRILNAWSAAINQVVSGELFQLPVMQMVQAAELLRTYPGWAPTDFTRFKNVSLNYFYPACHNFLGGCGSWPGWDAPANACILYIGILCDDQAKFDEAINYYKTGTGGGNILNAIPHASGQISEMGRDQPHAEIGPTIMAEMCQTALNQGVDLFGFSSNRLLAGFEYFSKFNLNNAVNWVPYNDCDNHNFLYLALSAQNRISQAPAYELIYNYYVVSKGLSAPFTRAMINLRGMKAVTGEYLGYCGLTYTLSDTTTIFNPKPLPIAPTGLTATAGLSSIALHWTKPTGNVANGYSILRSTSAGGTFTPIGTLDYNTSTEYIDKTVTNGTTYYYKVSARNQSGTGAASGVAIAVPAASGTAIPVEWNMNDVGTVASNGSTVYADANNKTFVVTGSGVKIGGNADSHAYLNLNVTGDFTITSRLLSTTLSSTNADRAGIIMRESLNANSAMASIGLGDSGFRTVWLATRATTAGGTSWSAGDSHTWQPVWFRLQRVGNVFAGYQSSDGITWFSVGSVTISMSASYYVGFYVCSGSTTAGVTTAATFDNISGTGTVNISGNYMLTNVASIKKLDNLGLTTDGSEVGQWINTGSNSQKWAVEPYGDYYRLKCIQSGKYLDGLGHTANASTVGQWAGTGSNNQQWSIVPQGGSYRLVNRSNGKCIDTGGGTIDGSIMQFWPQANTNNQLWILTKL